MPGGEKSAEQRLTARKTLRRNTGLASAPRLVRRGLWSDKSSALALGALRHTASRRRLRAGRWPQFAQKRSIPPPPGREVFEIMKSFFALISV